MNEARVGNALVTGTYALTIEELATLVSLASARPWPDSPQQSPEMQLLDRVWSDLEVISPDQHEHALDRSHIAWSVRSVQRNLTTN